MSSESIDKKRKEQIEQGKERAGEKSKKGSSSSSSGSSSQIDRINKELAKPNLPDSARQSLLKKKEELKGK
ncbi:hypothetical protein QUA82_31960 [Microcoleus sp. F8-D3]